MPYTIVITPAPRKPSDPQVVYLDAAIILGVEVFVRDYCSKVRGIEPDRAAIRAFNDRIGQPIDNDSWFKSQEPDWQRYVGQKAAKVISELMWDMKDPKLSPSEQGQIAGKQCDMLWDRFGNHGTLVPNLLKR